MISNSVNVFIKVVSVYILRCAIVSYIPHAGTFFWWPPTFSMVITFSSSSHNTRRAG